MSERERRMVENEIAWRELNELVPADMFGLMFCECGRPDCVEQFPIQQEAYERLRSESRWFAVVPGHEIPATETIIERQSRYVVVEKRGEAGELAEASDPRENGSAPV